MGVIGSGMTVNTIPAQLKIYGTPVRMNSKHFQEPTLTTSKLGFLKVDINFYKEMLV